MDDQPAKKRQAVALLICGLALGAALLLLRAGARNTLSHDDAISYLAATGHMGAYATDIPAGRWVPAQTWQAYWTPDRFGVFRQIGRDLARYDIHPPLYFWLLHVWIQVTGVRLSAGPLLNTVFLLLGAWLIALACRLARCSWSASVLAAVMWLLSGATLSVAGETRQYSLLGLVVAGLAASILFFLDRRSLGAALLVYATAAAGLLVHYQFAAVLAVAVLIAAILLARGGQWRVVVFLFAAPAAAGVTFLMLHPEFMGSFAMQRSQAAPFVWIDVPYRVTRILYALFEQVMLAPMARALGDAAASYWGIFLLLALAAGLGVWLVARRKGDGGKASRAEGETFLLVFAAATFLLVSALYIFQFSPRHAMGAQYLMAVSPLLFMAGAMVFDRLTSGLRWRPVLILALIAYQAAYGGWTTRDTGANGVGASGCGVGLGQPRPPGLRGAWGSADGALACAGLDAGLCGDAGRPARQLPRDPGGCPAAGLRERSPLRERRRQAASRAGATRGAGFPCGGAPGERVWRGGGV